MTAGVSRVLVVDPPWEQGMINGRPLPYPTMTVDAIAALRLGDAVVREGYLFCWTTNKFLGSAFECLRSWGVTYRQTIVWRKQGRAALGGLFATDLEFCLVGQRIGARSHAHGKRTRGVRVPTSVFDWPVGRHSEKPAEFFALVESLLDGPYAEVFARTQRPGWQAYGNEIDGRDVRVIFAAAAA